MHGPGKYDDVATQVRELTHAQGVLVIILNGAQGSGFSVQATSELSASVLADLLENMAAQIRADAARPSDRSSSAH